MIVLTTTLPLIAVTVFVAAYVVLAAIGAYTLTGFIIEKITANRKRIKVKNVIPGTITVNTAGNIVYTNK